MKNKAIDMHNILVKQLERLDDETTKGEDLQNEFKRADSMSKIAAQIISNGRLVLDTIKVSHEIGVNKQDLPDMLNGKPVPEQIPYLTKNAKKD
jgi:hypothetical protein